MADPTETQSEWLATTNPDALLTAARPLLKVTSKFSAARQRRRELYDRRLRLFGCACARMVWDLLPTDARNAVVISERFAYGQATHADLRAAAVRITLSPVTYAQLAVCAAGQASTAVSSVAHTTYDEFDWNPSDAARNAARAIATRTAGRSPTGSSPVAAGWEAAWNAAYLAARARQAEYVRDIFPPPDHAVRALRCDPAWLTSTVMALARQADDTGEYGVLPILADALQDAGCDNEFILDRCRAESGLHSRGNWVVDLLLGRE